MKEKFKQSQTLTEKDISLGRSFQVKKMIMG